MPREEIGRGKVPFGKSGMVRGMLVWDKSLHPQFLSWWFWSPEKCWSVEECGKLGARGEATRDNHSLFHTGKTRKKTPRIYLRSLRTTLNAEDKEFQPQLVLGRSRNSWHAGSSAPEVREARSHLNPQIRPGLGR